jgi:hypothetical protein
MWPTNKATIIRKLSYDHLLTNMLAAYEPLILQAAKETGFDIYVNDFAETMSGMPMMGYIEVRTRERRNHSPFWDRFDELKREQLKALTGVEL